MEPSEGGKKPPKQKQNVNNETLQQGWRKFGSSNYTSEKENCQLKTTESKRRREKNEN